MKTIKTLNIILTAARYIVAFTLGLMAFFLLLCEEVPGTPLSHLIIAKLIGFALAVACLIVCGYGKALQEILLDEAERVRRIKKWLR